MSPFARLLPQTLCCFYLPHHYEDQWQQHSSPALRVQPTVPKKPVSYAMINVPHEPEMTDSQQFRRIFTQSPACPHGSTPTKNPDKRKQLRPQCSLDPPQTYTSGSPLPLPRQSSPMQQMAKHIKQKLSEPRPSKSSLGTEKYQGTDRDGRSAHHRRADTKAIMLSVSPRSTGLSDLLKSTNGSSDVYDEDAQSIRTAQFRSPIGTLKMDPTSREQQVNDDELRPEDSASSHLPSPKPTTTIHRVPSECESKYVSEPKTPEKMKFNEALKLQSSESLSMALEWLSAGIANGTIEEPTTSDVSALKALDARNPPDASKSHPHAFLRASSLRRGNESPRTVVTRLSSRVGREQRQISQPAAPSCKPSPALEQIDRALLEYSTLFSHSESPSELEEATEPHDTPVAEVPTGISANTVDCGQQKSTTIVSPCQSETDLASVKTSALSESQSSVHLFNMQISDRLASKSTATALSPVGSDSNSRKSLNLNSALGTSLAVSHSTNVCRPVRIRAEHNRLPSDPHTRQLFESSNPSSSLFRKSRHKPLDLNKLSPISCKRGDDPNSNYAQDGDPPSSASNLSSFDGTSTRIRTRNSLAIGGRSSSLEVSNKRAEISWGKQSRVEPAAPRSLSSSATERSELLVTASSIIEGYTDETAETKVTLELTPTVATSPQADSSLQIQDSENRQSYSVPVSQSLSPDPPIARRASAGWLANENRPRWNFYLINDASPSVSRQHNTRSATPPNVDVVRTPLTESATQMWNRAYREARKTSGTNDLLSTPTFDLDTFRHRSSFCTPPPRRKSIPLLKTPSTIVRRSQSADPQHCRPPRDLQPAVKSSIATRLKRLSLRRLRPERSQSDPASTPRKIQKRSWPEPCKEQKALMAKPVIQDMIRAGSTPPLRELLGLWGSLPSHERSKRDGPAGTTDNVLARDFAPLEYEVNSSPLTPTQLETPSRAISVMQGTFRLLSFKPKDLDRKRTKSLSFPIEARDRARKSTKASLFDRLRQLYRTSSTEWRNSTFTGTHPNSVCVSKPIEYPELETLPGEGMFSKHTVKRKPVFEFHGEPTESNHHNIPIQSYSPDITPTMPRTSHLQPETLWRQRSDSSLAEPVDPSAVPYSKSRQSTASKKFPSTHNNTENTDYPSMAELGPRPSMNTGISTLSRYSRERPMPGGFAHD